MTLNAIFFQIPRFFLIHRDLAGSAADSDVMFLCSVTTVTDY